MAEEEEVTLGVFACVCCCCVILPLVLFLPIGAASEPGDQWYLFQLALGFSVTYASLLIFMGLVAIPMKDDLMCVWGFTGFASVMAFILLLSITLSHSVVYQVSPQSGPIDGGTTITIRMDTIDDTIAQVAFVTDKDLAKEPASDDVHRFLLSRIISTTIVRNTSASSNFSRVTTVTAANATRLNDTTFSFNRRTNKLGDLHPSEYLRTVKVNMGDWSLNPGVYFQLYPTPTVTRVTDHPLLSSTVTMIGTGFVKTNDTAVVGAFDDTSGFLASFPATIVDSTKITFKSDINVQNNPNSFYKVSLNGQQYHGSNSTTFRILSMSPVSASLNVPVQVSISGSGFLSFPNMAFEMRLSSGKLTLTGSSIDSNTQASFTIQPTTVTEVAQLFYRADPSSGQFEDTGVRFVILGASGFTPIIGPNTGGTQISVAGSFVPFDTFICKFGNVNITGTFVNDGTVQCVTPPLAVGQHPFSLIVESLGTSQTNSFSNPFTVVLPIRLSSANGINRNSGETLTVKGENFSNASVPICQLDMNGVVVQLAASYVDTQTVTFNPVLSVQQISQLTFPRNLVVSCSPNGQQFSNQTTTTTMYCPVGSWADEKSPSACISCTPASACPGLGKCAEGYVGRQCGSCTSNPKYYRSNGECLKCPDVDASVFVLILAGIIFIVAIGFYKGASAAMRLKHKLRSLGSMLIIFINFSQITALIAEIDFKWPVELRTFLRDAFSIFLFDLEIVSPECSLDLTYADKWAITVTTPLTILVLYLIFLGMMALVVSRKKLDENQSMMKEWLKSSTKAVHSFALLLSLSYIYLSRKTLEPLDCTLQPDGVRTLDAEPGVLCSETDVTYATVAGVSWLFLILWVIGIPVALGYAIFYGRKNDLFDSTPLVQDENDTEEQILFHEMFSFLYIDFKPRRWWWELTILIRKVLVSVVPMLLSSERLQTAAAWFLFSFLLINAILTAWASPYCCERYVCRREPELCRHFGPSTRAEIASLFSTAMIAVLGYASNESTDQGSKDAITVIVMLLVLINVVFSVGVVLLDFAIGRNPYIKRYEQLELGSRAVQDTFPLAFQYRNNRWFWEHDKFRVKMWHLVFATLGFSTGFTMCYFLYAHQSKQLTEKLNQLIEQEKKDKEKKIKLGEIPMDDITERKGPRKVEEKQEEVQEEIQEEIQEDEQEDEQEEEQHSKEPIAPEMWTSDED